MRKNWKYIKYTLKHWVALNHLALKCKVWKPRFLLHDLDKVILYTLGWDKERVTEYHRSKASHHCPNGQEPRDPLQAVLDWECARFTKPDKPLNARQTWHKYYPQLLTVEPYIELIESQSTNEH